MNDSIPNIRKAFRFAFPYTIPIFAGSMEFVAVNLLLGAFNPLQALALTLMINARHLFYGISMLDKYKGTGWKKPYLIFGMCDESFSINYTANIPADIDQGWFMFFVTLLNHLYWFTGATLGGIFGSLIHFDTEGLDFVMTAMFVVIFLEQWLKETQHESSLRKEKSDNDTITANHHNRHGNSGNGPDTLCSIPAFSCWKADTQIHTIPW